MSITDITSQGRSESRAMADRTPPQDLGAEMCVLGACLLSKDAVASVIEELKYTDFYKPAHETIFSAIIDLFGRGEPADAVTVSDALAKSGDLLRVGGAPYLHTLVGSVPNAASASYYARIVSEQATLRRLVNAGTKITALGYAGEGDVDGLVNEAQAEIYAVTEARTAEDYQPLGALMQGAIEEIEAIDNRDGQMVGVPTGFVDLDRLTNGLHPGQMIIIAARPAVGKALALDTPLPTPSGWTTMGEIQVGDQVIAADGMPTRVVAATDVMTGRPCFEVEFDDGSVIVADAQHQWLTHAAGGTSPAPRGAVRTTAEIAATLRTEGPRADFTHAVSDAAALRMPQQQLPLAPYLLGVWLGDGYADRGDFNSADPEIAGHLEADGFKVIFNPVDCYQYSVSLPPASIDLRDAQVTTSRSEGTGVAVAAPLRVVRDGMTAKLMELGLINCKHIPAPYLRGSLSQRQALLAGLLDADGTVTPAGAVALTTTSARLCTDVAELMRSLGYRPRVSGQRVQGDSEATSTCYTIAIDAAQDVFRLERKTLIHRERRRPAPAAPLARTIVDVRPIASVPVRCVEVDNDEHLYLAGTSMIPTHNSTVGLDIARAASLRHGLTTAIFSLEMSRNEIMMRLFSAEAQIELGKLRGTKKLDDRDWMKLVKVQSTMADKPLFIDDSPNLTLMEIRAKCRRLRQNHDLRLVVVDYLQLMTSGKKVESRQQEVSEFSRSLKLLAKELQVPIIAICQLNRGSEQRSDKKPMLSDLRESGSLEQDADMVLLLHREDMYDRDSPRPGEADFLVVKHRNGPTDEIAVSFQGHYSRFVDMAVE